MGLSSYESLHAGAGADLDTAQTRSVRGVARFSAPARKLGENAAREVAILTPCSVFQARLVVERFGTRLLMGQCIAASHGRR